MKVEVNGRNKIWNKSCLIISCFSFLKYRHPDPSPNSDPDSELAFYWHPFWNCFWRLGIFLTHPLFEWCFYWDRNRWICKTWVNQRRFLRVALIFTGQWSLGAAPTLELRLRAIIPPASQAYPLVGFFNPPYKAWLTELYWKLLKSVLTFNAARCNW